MTTNKVLIPLDGSAFAQEVLKHIQRLLHPAGCELILLRVTDPPAGLMPLPPRPVSIAWPVAMYESRRDVERASHPIYASQAWASECASLADELVPVVHGLKEAGFSASVAVRVGDPVEEIVRFAETEGVGLIAMATHGRTGLRRLVMGSVAEGVLHRMEVPVLLIRPCDDLTSDQIVERAAALDLEVR